MSPKKKVIRAGPGRDKVKKLASGQRKGKPSSSALLLGNSVGHGVSSLFLGGGDEGGKGKEVAAAAIARPVPGSSGLVFQKQADTNEEKGAQVDRELKIVLSRFDEKKKDDSDDDYDDEDSDDERITNNSKAGYPMFRQFILSDSLFESLSPKVKKGVSTGPRWMPHTSGVSAPEQIEYFEESGWEGLREKDIYPNFPVYANKNCIVLAGTCIYMYTTAASEYARIKRKAKILGKVKVPLKCSKCSNGRDKTIQKSKANISLDRRSGLQEKINMRAKNSTAPKANARNNDTKINLRSRGVKAISSSKKVETKKKRKLTWSWRREAAMMRKMRSLNPNFTPAEVNEINRYTYVTSQLRDETLMKIKELGKDKTIVIFFQHFFGKYSRKKRVPKYKEPEMDEKLGSHVGIIVVRNNKLGLFDCNNNAESLKQNPEATFYLTRARTKGFRYIRKKFRIFLGRKKTVAPAQVANPEGIIPVGVAETCPPYFLRNCCSIVCMFFAEQIWRGNPYLDINIELSAVYLYADMLGHHFGVYMPHYLVKLGWSQEYKYPYQEILDRLMAAGIKAISKDGKFSVREAVKQELMKEGAKEDEWFNKIFYISLARDRHMKQDWMN